MSAQEITPALRQWIEEQTEAGHAVEAVLSAMHASGWAKDVALSALEAVLLDRLSVRRVDQGRLPDLVRPSASEVWAHDRHIQVLVQTTCPRIAVLSNVLSPQECQDLMALARPRLARSETVATETGGSEVNEARTSQGMFFERGESELCARIEQRIAALFQWPVENGEGIQVLRYGPGAQYKPHYDYFDPAQSGTASILRRGGQRVATLVMYLNTPQAGGATIFPDIGLEVNAMAGHAVFFAYGTPHPSSQTLHGGLAVESGEKWVATKWMRQARFE